MSQRLDPVADSAMILAAGLGQRMRPLSDRRPKPLLPIAGQSIIDHALDRLSKTGVRRVVVNLHYKSALIRRHLAKRESPEIVFSDESQALLDTGGGVAKALPMVAADYFFVVNGVSLWFDGMQDTLGLLAQRFDPAAMDALLLLHATAAAIGYHGVGDFLMHPDGRLQRRAESTVAPFVFTGVQVLSSALFCDCPTGAFSLNRLYDRAAEADRLYGLRHDGDWMNLKTPDGLVAAERAVGA